LKVRINVEGIVDSNTIYPPDFIETIKKYKDTVFETWEDPFGYCEIDIEGRTYALSDNELIVVEL